MQKERTKLRLTTYGIYEVDKNNGLKRVLFRLRSNKWFRKIHEKELIYLPGKGAHILININALAIIACRSNETKITFKLPNNTRIKVNVLDILTSNKLMLIKRSVFENNVLFPINSLKNKEEPF